MSARRATPQSGSPIQADEAPNRDSVVHQLRHRTWSPDRAPEERPAARRTDPPASRRSSSSFTQPIRESFFDLAQRYQRLRESAFRSTRPKKSPAPVAPVAREPRLTDLPPPLPKDGAPEREYLDSYIEENTEEATLVQPLARRASDPPPASERREYATVRPPPPPDPLPRISPRIAPHPVPRIVARTMPQAMPSTMPPPPVALATMPPPPPGPPPSIWRPMLATAVLSATIGAAVSVGLWAVRTSPPAPPLRPTIIAAAPKDTAASGTAPCPIPASYAGTSTTTGTNSSPSRLSAAAPQVSLDNLPVENSSSRGQATPLLRAPRGAAVSHAMAARSVTSERAASRSTDDDEETSARAKASDGERPSKRSRKAKAESESSDEDEALQERMGAPAPPPTPTAGPDKAAIAKAVGRAAASATSCDAGPQSGRAQITFAPSGNVASVSLIQSFSDNAVNGCVMRALGRARVPPFTGDPVSVRKGLSW
jgi:hypothetical protein